MARKVRWQSETTHYPGTNERETESTMREMGVLARREGWTTDQFLWFINKVASYCSFTLNFNFDEFISTWNNEEKVESRLRINSRDNVIAIFNGVTSLIDIKVRSSIPNSAAFKRAIKPDEGKRIRHTSQRATRG